MKIAILACGNIAQTMAKTLKGMAGVTMYAVGARSLEKAEAFAKEFGFEKAYGSYEELVKDPEIDLIYVASPHSHHYEHMKLCIENGKNVLCEKALTMNRKQAEEIFALAKEKKVLVTEAMWVRYLPMAKTLRDVLDSGIIGDINVVTANLYYNIDMNQRIVDPALAGGALLDVGVYTLTFAALVMGEDYETMTTSCVKFDTGVDQQSCVVLTYEGGKMAVLNSGTKALSDRKGIISGRDGYIIVENINNFESISVYNTDRELIKRIDAPAQITGYEYEVYAAMDAIEKGLTECPECPHEISLKIMETMDEARRQMGIVYPGE